MTESNIFQRSLQRKRVVGVIVIAVVLCCFVNYRVYFAIVWVIADLVVAGVADLRLRGLGD